MRAASFLAMAIALLGCNCDGERNLPKQPKPPIVTAPGEAGVDGAGAGSSSIIDGAVARMPGFLDAPGGTLDRLFESWDAAERGDRGGRSLMLFFGDSHTAGDSMTSRLRTTLQAKF